MIKEIENIKYVTNLNGDRFKCGDTVTIALWSELEDEFYFEVGKISDIKQFDGRYNNTDTFIVVQYNNRLELFKSGNDFGYNEKDAIDIHIKNHMNTLYTTTWSQGVYNYQLVHDWIANGYLDTLDKKFIDMFDFTKTLPHLTDINKFETTFKTCHSK